MGNRSAMFQENFRRDQPESEQNSMSAAAQASSTTSFMPGCWSGRLRYIKNPATGKRVSRINLESEWIRTEVSELRIVDEDLLRPARQRQAEIAKQLENVTKGVRAWRAKHVNELRRPSFLFSGPRNHVPPG